jgi:hypothetical protein
MILGEYWPLPPVESWIPSKIPKSQSRCLMASDVEPELTQLQPQKSTSTTTQGSKSERDYAKSRAVVAIFSQLHIKRREPGKSKEDGEKMEKRWRAICGDGYFPYKIPSQADRQVLR